MAPPRRYRRSKGVIQLHKLLVVAAALAAVLAFAAPAFADTQELVVTSYNATPGAKADTDIDVLVPAAAQATAKIAVYLPSGSSLSPAAAVGTSLGTVDAMLNAKELGGTNVPATGKIVVDDPAKYVSDPVAQACAPGAHAAVWLLQLSAGGTAFNVPVFVDPTTGTDTALGAFLLQACFLSPDVPSAQGGAPLGGRVLEIDLETTGVVVNGPTGTAVWRTFVTPFTTGTATPNPAATVEVRCDMLLPHRIKGLKSLYSKITKKVTITGTLIGGTAPRAGVHVRIDAGPKPSFASLKPWAVATTDRTGHFKIVKLLPKTVYAFVYVNPYFATTCNGASTAPGGCVREDTSPEFGPLVVLVHRR